MWYCVHDSIEHFCFIFFFFSSRRRHTRCREVSWARRCVQETELRLFLHNGGDFWFRLRNRLHFFIIAAVFPIVCHTFCMLLLISFLSHLLKIPMYSALIPCLLYTSDAADDTPCVDLGGRRIIKKKKTVFLIGTSLVIVYLI
eukprot:TRINITY_DN12807_c0_g1_i3.p1 TRINITY_DN12807_c0_g1~~TRINITY_DN12807_c0_g1_i3.p1  ORF type:complete len:143 (+),score=45.08 TRINITY_DN12807_c0_g1_i3:49-477(+)